MTAHSRTKGAAFERRIAADLFALTGIKFRRELRQYQESERVDLTADDPAWPFALELKHRKENNFRTAWLDQAKASARLTSQFPAVVYRIGEGARAREGVRIPAEAVIAAGGGSPGDGGVWLETDLEGLCTFARELMARNAA